MTNLTVFTVLETNNKVSVNNDLIDAIKVTKENDVTFLEVFFSNIPKHPSYKVSKFNTTLPTKIGVKDGDLYYNPEKVALEEIDDNTIWMTLACGEKIKCQL